MRFDVAPASHTTRRVLLAASVLTLVLACAHGASKSGPVELPSEPAPPSISLSEVEPGQWKVVVDTSQPTTDLRFVRNPDDSRARRWQVERDFELVHAIDAEIKRASQGARDLFDVWAQFLSRARAGAPLDADTFLCTATELGAVKAAAFARALATSPQKAPLQFLRAGLSEPRGVCHD